MFRIAYVDHSYHKKTSSTQFIPELLASRGHQVDFFWDNAWNGGSSIELDQVSTYDAVIMFQSHCPIVEGDSFSNHHDNVIYIPMLDQFGVWRGPISDTTHFWKKFQGCKVMNFSSAVHGMTVGMGIRSKLFRFYREPVANPIQRDGLHGFLWIRLEDEVSWGVVKKLIADTQFDSFHLHIATDPTSKKVVLPSKSDVEKYNITLTEWFDNKDDFFDVLSNANVFFAPRMEEGIGQSILEAIARGQCVVAADNGTMNEYIQHGFTGLLYDWGNPIQIDFSQASKIGKQAYKSGVAGYQNWLNSHSDLEGFIMCSMEQAYKGRYKGVIVPSGDAAQAQAPKISWYARVRKMLGRYYVVRVVYKFLQNRIF